MSEQRVSTGYVPRPWQLEVHNDLKRFSVLVVHRRGGKTVLAVNLLIDAALRCKKPMGRFGYIAPLLKQARQIAWDYVQHFTAEIPGMHYNQQAMVATFPNGARVSLFGADNPDSLRGLYFDGVVMDEVADMRPQVWGEVIRPALSDRQGWALFIGTPKGINLFSERYFAALNDPDWHAALYTCYDTDDALSKEEIERAKIEMTEPQFAQEYLCDFHAAVENALMSVGDVQAAMDRVYRQDAYDFAPRIMGLDVAWMGNDRSCLAKVQGVQAFGHKVWHGIDPMDLASQAGLLIDGWKPHAVFVDVGYAPGVYARLRDLGYPVTPVHFGGRPRDPRFENKRAEMWFDLADWIKTGALPHDPELINDFCAPTYNMRNRNGRIQLESKDDMRARGLPSPDIGDAYALTRAEPVAASIAALEGMGQGTTALHEYDPMMEDR